MATLMLCKRAFFICAVPRVGSYLLCDLLQHTGVAGNPNEYREHNGEGVRGDFSGFRDHRSYFLHFAHRLSVTSNGIFSAKMMFEQMASFASDVSRYKSIDGGGMMETIELAFGKPRYIQILRKDRERQAVSFVRAAQTGAWTLSQASDGPSEYDPSQLERGRDFLMQKETAWNEALKNIDATRRMTLYYEDLLKNMENTVSTLLRWLEIADPPRPFAPPSIKPQSDPTSEDWLNAWRSTPER